MGAHSNDRTTVTDTESPRPRRGRDAAGTGIDDRPILESRHRRLAAYLRHNGERIVRDTAVLATWALVLAIPVQEAGVPRWLCYFLTFVGVVAYTRATSPWSRPYRSPDDLESAPSRP